MLAARRLHGASSLLRAAEKSRVHGPEGSLPRVMSLSGCFCGRLAVCLVVWGCLGCGVFVRTRKRDEGAGVAARRKGWLFCVVMCVGGRVGVAVIGSEGNGMGADG